jgi:hypothetical protein
LKCRTVEHSHRSSDTGVNRRRVAERWPPSWSPVDDVDADALPVGDGLEHCRTVRVVDVADGALPEARVGGWDVEVARQPVEPLGPVGAVGIPLRELGADGDRPTVQHGDAGARVAQVGGQVDDVVLELDDGLSALHVGEVAVVPHDLLGRVLRT